VTTRFVEEAQGEFLDAISYYEEACDGLGARFKDEVDRGIRCAAGRSDLYRLRIGGYRRINLRVFHTPFLILFVARSCGFWRLLMRRADLFIGSPGATKRLAS
jgi:hypothetical protein